jgi:hypothetical protein
LVFKSKQLLGFLGAVHAEIRTKWKYYFSFTVYLIKVEHSKEDTQTCQGRKLRKTKTKGEVENQRNARLCIPESRKPGFLNNKSSVHTPEIEFLDINLRKESRLLLHAIHSPFYWWILKKTILYSGFITLIKKSAK